MSMAGCKNSIESFKFYTIGYNVKLTFSVLNMLSLAIKIIIFLKGNRHRGKIDKAKNERYISKIPKSFWLN